MTESLVTRWYGKSAPKIQQEWFSVEEASRWLGCEPSTIYRKVQRGELRASRLGKTGTYRFRKADLEAMLTLAGQPTEEADE